MRDLARDGVEFIALIFLGIFVAGVVIWLAGVFKEWRRR